MAPDTVIGTWSLISYETRSADGTVRRPFGQHPRGYLMYSAEGLMSVAIMPERAARRDTSTDAIADPYRLRSWLSLQGARRLVRYVLAATRYISYSGRYAVRGNTIVHHIEVSQMPGLIQTSQIRTCELHGDRLVLTAQTAGASQRLVWARVATPVVRDAVAALSVS